MRVSAHEILTHFLVPALASFLAVCGLTPLARRVAVRTGVLDKPSAKKAHARPTPYLGGVALAIGCFVAGTLVHGWSKGAYAVAAGAALVAVIGLLDDLRNLHPAPRLAVEVGAALAAAGAGARVHLFGGPLDWVITVAWIVVLTNSFNLLDNMDGAAGGIASVTAGSLAVAAGIEGQYLVGGLASVVAGACLGFLLFNWAPARIFMGDAGSLFLGYMLSVIALQLRFSSAGRIEGIAAVLLLSGVALFDTTLVTISRKQAGRPFYVGGTDHFSHRLKRLGMPIRAVAAILCMLTGASCTLGILVGRNVVPVAWVAFVPVIAAIALYRLLRMDMYSAGPPVQPADFDVVPRARERRVAVGIGEPGLAPGLAPGVASEPEAGPA